MSKSEFKIQFNEIRLMKCLNVNWIIKVKLKNKNFFWIDK